LLNIPPFIVRYTARKVVRDNYKSQLEVA